MTRRRPAAAPSFDLSNGHRRVTITAGVLIAAVGIILPAVAAGVTTAYSLGGSVQRITAMLETHEDHLRRLDAQMITATEDRNQLLGVMRHMDDNNARAATDRNTILSTEIDLLRELRSLQTHTPVLIVPPTVHEGSR